MTFALLCLRKSVKSALNRLVALQLQQARDGCFCAHTYLADLLHLSDAQVVAFRSLYLDRKIYRQGATRLSFPWFMSEEEVTYIIEAVAWISEWGW